MTAPEMPISLTIRQCRQLCRLGAATLYEAQGKRGAMDHGIKPLDPASALSGRAFTVDCSPGDNLVLHLAVTLARPGDVLVVNANGFLEAGHWGDLLTVAAQQRRIAGLVIDGAVRDVSAIVDLGFPVFARGVSIKAAGKSRSGQINVDLVCGGMLVHPGDVVVGDRDGVVVIGAAGFSATLRAAQARQKEEDCFRRALARGATTVELLELAPKLKEMGLSDSSR